MSQGHKVRPGLPLAVLFHTSRLSARLAAWISFFRVADTSAGSTGRSWVLVGRSSSRNNRQASVVSTYAQLVDQL